jgi:MoaA/NifB/PqqE/SkfB family radical SAM enzyme
MAISVDGPDAPNHDGFRHVDGTYKQALFALRYARRIGLDTQVLTTATRRNLSGLAKIA